MSWTRIPGAIKREGSVRRALFVCLCGKQAWVQVVYGQPVSRSCGSCAMRRHGHRSGRDRSSPTYRSWRSMVVRCTRWIGDGGFDRFLADMGERPAGTTIDRWPDRHGNYEPGNCRWATWRAQAKNKDAAVLISYGGRTLCVAEWAREIGLGIVTLHHRLFRSKWTVEKALNTPSKRRKGRDAFRPAARHIDCAEQEPTGAVVFEGRPNPKPELSGGSR
jgi:hypothetical protein